MSLRLPLFAALAASTLLLAPARAGACSGDCDCDHGKKSQAKKTNEVGDEKAKDDAVTAKCNCEGPADCTCKKGECKCKKCSKNHHQTAGEKSSGLLPPLKGSVSSPEVPANARLDASAGLFI